MKLVDDARKAWKWFSVRAMAAAAALQATWLQLPDDLRQSLAHIVAYLTIALLALGVVGRLVKQEVPPAGDKGQ